MLVYVLILMSPSVLPVRQQISSVELKTKPKVPHNYKGKYQRLERKCIFLLLDFKDKICINNYFINLKANTFEKR